MKDMVRRKVFSANKYYSLHMECKFTLTPQCGKILHCGVLYLYVFIYGIPYCKDWRLKQ